jgi:3-dehydroquinate synthase
MTELTVIPVTGTNSYDVVIGRSLLNEIPKYLGDSVKKVLVIHPVGLAISAEEVRTQLTKSGYEVLLAGVPDSEDAKRVEVAAFCWGILGKADFTRTDAVIGFGGGSTTDLAGFVAATWLRGVKVIQIPTTLLGMVDAAVGGKTGINTAEGKNLVGAFHAPSAVLIDLNTLETLPRNELLASYGEIVKCGFIADEKILEILEADVEVATDIHSDEFRELIERCVRIKARVVSEDLKDLGIREILNYGHTLGHAIEHNERYQWRHGVAVAIGMVFVAELAQLAGKLSPVVVDRHRSILRSLGLPVSYRGGEFEKLLATMQRDKKSRAGSLRFVVLDDVAKTSVLTAPSVELLHAAYQEILD